MTDLLIRGAALIVAGCIAAMLIGGLMEFARWVITRTLSAIQQTIYGLGRLIKAGSKACAWALKATTRWILRRSLALICFVTEPLRRWLVRQRDAVFGMFNDRDANAQANDAGASRRRHEEPRWGDASGGAKSSHADEHDSSGSDEPDGQRSAYDQALALLGLESVRPLTSALLRERYRAIIGRVHPDQGFPSQEFAKQVNAAVRTIRKTHGWH